MQDTVTRHRSWLRWRARDHVRKLETLTRHLFVELLTSFYPPPVYPANPSFYCRGPSRHLTLMRKTIIIFHHTPRQLSAQVSIQVWPFRDQPTFYSYSKPYFLIYYFFILFARNRVIVLLTSPTGSAPVLVSLSQSPQRSPRFCASFLTSYVWTSGFWYF